MSASSVGTHYNSAQEKSGRTHLLQGEQDQANAEDRQSALESDHDKKPQHGEREESDAPDEMKGIIKGTHFLVSIFERQKK